MELAHLRTQKMEIEAAMERIAAAEEAGPVRGVFGVHEGCVRGI